MYFLYIHTTQTLTYTLHIHATFVFRSTLKLSFVYIVSATLSSFKYTLSLYNFRELLQLLSGFLLYSFSAAFSVNSSKSSTYCQRGGRYVQAKAALF